MDYISQGSLHAGIPARFSQWEAGKGGRHRLPLHWRRETRPGTSRLSALNRVCNWVARADGFSSLVLATDLALPPLSLQPKGSSGFLSLLLGFHLLLPTLIPCGITWPGLLFFYWYSGYRSCPGKQLADRGPGPLLGPGDAALEEDGVP